MKKALSSGTSIRPRLGDRVHGKISLGPTDRKALPGVGRKVEENLGERKGTKNRSDCSKILLPVPLGRIRIDCNKIPRSFPLDFFGPVALLNRPLCAQREKRGSNNSSGGAILPGTSRWQRLWISAGLPNSRRKKPNEHLKIFNGRKQQEGKMPMI